MRGRTIPTHHPPPPRTAWTPQRGTTPGRVHRVPYNAHRGPGRTRRASPAASIPTLDTTHRVSGTRTRLNAPSELGPISRVRALAPLHLRGTTWTRTGRRRRRHVAWGHTILIPALAIRRIASKRALVTTLTKRDSLARPPAPLVLTTISPGQLVLPTALTPNLATISHIPDQPLRVPANSVSFSRHRDRVRA